MPGFTRSLFARWRRPAYGLLVPTLVVAFAAPAGAAGRGTELVSVSTAGSQTNRSSAEQVISTNGRFVAFSSLATDLVPGDTNRVADIFLRDLRADTTARVSLTNSGRQSNGRANQPAISERGRYVSFGSDATNLVSGDTNNQPDIFLRDVSAGTTRRVSVGPGGAQGNGDSASSSVSANGRYVTFISSSTNLVPGDSNGTADVFVRDMVAGVTERISVSSRGAQANGFSDGPRISNDGRYLAFTSAASNLVPGDTNASWDVFVRDRVAGVTRRVSVRAGGGQGDANSSQASISADGRHVAFLSDATNLVPQDVNGQADVFVRDLADAVTELVSVGSNGALSPTGAEGPAVSANGRHIAFASTSALVPDDTQEQYDIYVRDRADAITTRVSVGSGGVEANSFSLGAAISGDGRRVAFHSSATNLVPVDANDQEDVFLHG